jgi:hypothetical protein
MLFPAIYRIIDGGVLGTRRSEAVEAPQGNGMSVRLGHEEKHGQMGFLDVGVCVPVSRLILSVSIKQEGICMFPMLNSHNRLSTEGLINALPLHDNTVVVTWSLRSLRDQD